MRIALLVFLSFFLFSCNKQQQTRVLSQQRLPVQAFEIDPSKDTMITTGGGTRISILKGTFPDNGPVQLEIKEALTMSDIVLAGLTTISDSIPLQSGGMLYINGRQGNEQPQILKPIEISVPAFNYDPGMQLFTGSVKKDSSVNWKDPQPLLDRQEKTIVDTGQQLFRSLCASCHAIEKDMTGPALAFVTERRCMEWLTGVTRFSSKWVTTDECMHAQREKFGSMMPDFPNLNQQQIEAIYAYITKESEKLNLPVDQHGRYDPCNSLTIKDTVNETVVNKKVTTVGKSNRPPEKETTPAGTGVMDRSAPDTSKKPSGKKLPDEYYTFTIDAFGWFNIDIYTQKDDPDFAEGKLFATVSGGSKDKLSVYLIVPSKKIFVSGYKNDAGKYYFFYREDGYVYLPQNTTAYILAVENVSEKPQLAKLKFTTSTQHEFQLTMQTGLDIEKEIADMKLDDVEFTMSHSKTEKKIKINERIYRFQCPAKPLARDSSATAPIVEGFGLKDTIPAQEAPKPKK